MQFVLLLAYYLEGFFMAIIACSGVGFVLATILALFKSLSRPRNLLLMLVYGGASVLCYLLFLAGLFIAGWIGDRTEHAGQIGIIAGAIFPGVFALTIIPKFLTVAAKQTSGIHVE